jgi:hypothetical protein
MKELQSEEPVVPKQTIDTGGPPCSESQADGVPCEEGGGDCEDCAKAEPAARDLYRARSSD